MANTRVHVATTDGSSGENKGGVSKAVAKGRDSETVVNAAKMKAQIIMSAENARQSMHLFATQAPPKNMKRKLPKNSAKAAYWSSCLMCSFRLANVNSWKMEAITTYAQGCQYCLRQHALRLNAAALVGVGAREDCSGLGNTLHAEMREADDDNRTSFRFGAVVRPPSLPFRFFQQQGCDPLSFCEQQHHTHTHTHTRAQSGRESRATPPQCVWKGIFGL